MGLCVTVFSFNTVIFIIIIWILYQVNDTSSIKVCDVVSSRELQETFIIYRHPFITSVFLEMGKAQSNGSYW